MRQSLNVTVICDNINLNPQCYHGPTLLFRRGSDTKTDYYACSACRDRRHCSFYLKSTDKNELQSERSVCKRRDAVAKISYKALKVLRSTLRKLAPEQRGYCHSCNALFVLESGRISHNLCQKIVGLSDRQMTHPTEICMPRENDKVEAQYLFSAEVARFVVDAVKKLGAARVLCVGTPRLHELFISDRSIPSLLLDIDAKYHNFYSKKEFIWYNMFNHFVMDERRKEDLNNYVRQNGKLIILMDPPFGGRVEPLAVTLDKIQKEYHAVRNRLLKHEKELSVIWFFPYFMERHIRDSLPNFHMLDYQVDYENHESFSAWGTRRRKAGSPVRIFTNIPLRLFDLSALSGYKYCDRCEYWVSETNWHCPKCQICTSKNGMRYRHCDTCGYCVKPSYTHCGICHRCCLPSHVCGDFKPDTSCYHCHQPGHKRVHCPEIVLSARNKKRRRV